MHEEFRGESGAEDVCNPAFRGDDDGGGDIDGDDWEQEWTDYLDNKLN